MNSFDTPILFLIFNRPDTTKRVFKEIRKVRPSRLFIAADGPRIGSTKDLDLCNQTKKIVSVIDWPCEVKTLFREENLGCKAAVSGAIEWFFSNMNEGVILEDDCLPDPSFFTFCREMLERYRDNKNIMMISGSNIAGSWDTDSSYFYSKYSNIWGWATWKRAWKLYDGNLSSWTVPAIQKNIQQRINDRQQWNVKKWSYSRAHSGNKNSWAYPWEFSMISNNGISIVPSKNLINNIGGGETATHTKNTTEETPTYMLSFPLIHPTGINIDDRYDKLFMKKTFKLHNLPTRILGKITRTLQIPALVNKAREFNGKRHGITTLKPNPRLPNYYLIKGDPKRIGTLVDVGCGFDADFSMYMIKNYGIKAVGIDPTLKHQPALEKLVQDNKGKFSHLKAAISASNGKITFNESVSNVSGSILDNHRNVREGDIIQYEVESIGLANLPDRLGLERIDYIKLDLEGAEYDLIKNLKDGDLDRYDQLFVEFHHHAIPTYGIADTKERVHKIESLGFKSFSPNNHDYIFYRS